MKNGVCVCNRCWVDDMNHILIISDLIIILNKTQDETTLDETPLSENVLGETIVGKTTLD